MATAGAKPTLDAAKAKTICKAVADGIPMLYAAEAVGVSERCLHGWLQKGRKPDALPLYAQFVQDMAAARLKALSFRLNRLKRVGSKNPKVDMWWCERMFPETFGADRRLINELLDEIARLRAERGRDDADAR